MKKATKEQLSRAHYRDAQLYDDRYKRRKLDIPHYVALAKRKGGRWLELGAGTGRVTLALAPHVRQLVAVEREPSLAKTLRTRAPENVEVRTADFLRARFERFDGIVAPFNIFSHVMDSQELRGLLERLDAPLLAFDVPMPNASVLARDPDRTYRVGKVKGVPYSEAFDYDPVAQTCLVTAIYGEERVLPLLQRMYFPAELRFIVETAGWTVASHDGGFDGEPLDVDSDSQVLICKQR